MALPRSGLNSSPHCYVIAVSGRHFSVVPAVRNGLYSTLLILEELVGSIERMKKFVFLGLLLLGIGILFACRDDIMIQSEEFVVGNYTGWLIFDSLSQGQAGGIRDSQPCEWVFTADSFTFNRPATVPDTTALVYCTSYGTYVLAEGLVLTQDKNWAQGAQVCDATRNLQGTFVILLHTKTELTFVQGSSGGVTKTVRLTKTG